MNIHHGIVKKAASKGVVLTIQDDEAVRAHYAEHGIVVEFTIEDDEPATVNELAQDALRDALEIFAYRTEHPEYRIVQEDGDFVASKGEEEIARDPVLEDLFETLSEQADEDDDQEDDDQEAEDDEDEETGSVVPIKYKVEYAERGDANHCGDWLALTLAGLCRVKNEKGKEITDLDRLETIASSNGVEPGRYGKLGIATNGWQGRYRMTVRNMLAPQVAAKGFLFVPEGCGYDADCELLAPREWCFTHSPKPKPVKAPKPEAAVTKQPKTTKARGDAGVEAASAAIQASKAKQAS